MALIAVNGTPRHYSAGYETNKRVKTLESDLADPNIFDEEIECIDSNWKKDLEELGPCELIESKEITDLEYDMRENLDLSAKRFSEGSEYESDDTTVGSWFHCDSISVNTGINECFDNYSTVFYSDDICLMTTYSGSKIHINKMSEKLNQQEFRHENNVIHLLYHTTNNL